MLSGFLFFTILIAVVGGVSIYLFNEVNHMANTHRLINQLQVYTLNLIKNDNDFFDAEVTNEKYFATHTSAYFSTRDKGSTDLNRLSFSMGLKILAWKARCVYTLMRWNFLK